ncbi:alpha-(1-_3)-arabinofuranosyltransferase family protein [Streptomyces sp. XD-27]|uniref:alpha-(1->3)-arabinofuranosyltransferase domain-containing protein n=1 Tax=Streptomyces sp. XD-27 TaxID=3062779 RepID=UPI0026F43C40|nr:alpha-(1->3)-arabinofuranosyltransferase family protein [Streptomyces sp. XD-27]WKX69287.1 alpha-(1->3)-arabinofuranosyltransferase family protein [Streptomyces sp. XD-27]
MTQVLHSPPPAPSAAAAAPPPDPGRPRGRRWLFGFWALVLAAFLAPSPGRMTFDTKLGVALDPFGFLGDLTHLWHDGAGFGGIADQYIGYAFPMLPYYALADVLHLPVWLAERLWLSIVVTTAFWGALRLAERLRVGSPATRLLAAAGYALWPTFSIVVGSTSAAALPGALLPWVLLPLTDPATSARVAAARSALLIPFMGGVNAASTLASLLPVGLYLLSRPAGKRRRALLAWWLPGVVLATAWWVVPLLLLGAYGEDFMPYVEQADTTTATMSATELLRGAGNWVAYLNFGDAWLPGGWTAATYTLAVLGSAGAAALGLAGLARRDLPERRWLLLTVLAVTLITLAGYGGALGAPFHGTVQEWLNGWLKPFRNIYKFQPGLALALAFGIAHLTAVAAARPLPVPGGGPTSGDGSAPDGGSVPGRPAGRESDRGPVPGRLSGAGRWLVPALAALLLLPGLALPYLNGTVLQPGAFKKLPGHWEQAADWLEKTSAGSRALVVPATAHGLYTWGDPIDQPLDVLADSRWAQRDYVPFGTPGSRRAMDAVEQALMTGAEVPGLRDFLTRAGLYDVVVRNDLDPDQLGYVPPQTVAATLEASGYRKVTGFGPLLTGGRIPDDTPVQVQGLFPRRQAVEIYRPVGTARPGPVGVRPVAATARVSGGPEALLQLSADPSLRNRPTVLTGDAHPGLDTPPLQVVADGLRRADTRFGLVNANTSYTYTADERNHSGSLQNPGAEPKQILPVSGTGHQTTAVLRGAARVTASSSGNWLFHLPQYDPVNAFDGNPDTAWAEGSAGRPAGQWLRADFTETVMMPASLQLTPLPGDGLRAAPTAVRVQTEQGSVDSPLQPGGGAQSVRAPAGPAKWLKITIVASQEPRPGLSGAGFSEVSVPGVQVTRLLALPSDAQGGDSPATVFSLHRGSDPGGLSPVSAEVGLHRQFRTTSPGEYAVSAQALPVPGRELDELLDAVAPGRRARISVTADSTSRAGAGLSSRNLVDGDLTTAWIAGDRPVLHLRWPKKKEIDEIVFGAAGGISTRPEQVVINSPDGAATAGVDENGQARFEPITTDRLDITISKTAPLSLHNPLAGRDLQLPVGLSEVYIPALDELRTPPPDPTARFALPCGQGPPLAVDGTLHATKASGRVRDLTERRPVTVELCAGDAEDGALDLGSGRHRVEAGDTGPLALTDVTLRRGTAPAPAAADRTVKATDWSGDDRTVRVGAGQAVYLQTYGNHNKGWHATLDGRRLTPLRIDGWQQGFLVPAGAGGTIQLSYQPSTTYQAGLVGGVLGVVLLLGLALIRRHAGAPAPEERQAAPPPPGGVLGTVALTAVLVLVAGPLALAVPVLALIAWWRPALLPPTALVAMAAAGIVAATGAGHPAGMDDGAFSPAAQSLALIALTAAVVTVPTRIPGRHAAGWPGDSPSGPPDGDREGPLDGDREGRPDGGREGRPDGDLAGGGAGAAAGGVGVASGRTIPAGPTPFGGPPPPVPGPLPHRKPGTGGPPAAPPDPHHHQQPHARQDPHDTGKDNGR